MDIPQVKIPERKWVTPVFYGAWVLLAAAIFCWGIFTVKAQVQVRHNNQLDLLLAGYGTSQQKADEQKLIAYKQEIDAFSALIDGHKISLPVFDFIEKNTLSNVWFSSVALSEIKGELYISGQANSLATVSQQINQFEQQTQSVSAISLLNSQTTQQGVVKFSLQLSLNPAIFDYSSAVAAGSVHASQ